MSANHNGSEVLSSVPLRNAKAALRRGETELQKLKTDEKAFNPDAGEVLDIARKEAQLEAKAIAQELDCSHSLVLRAFQSKDSLSFHKLWELDDSFWAALIVAIARKRKLATVRTTIEVSERRRA